MYAVISLKGRQNVFSQLLEELKYALRDITSQELKTILIEASAGSVRATYHAKKKSVKGLWELSKKAKALGLETIERYKTDGVIQSFEKDMDKLGELAMKLPAKAKMVYDNFLSQTREKQIETVASVILLTSIYLACCGGPDAEGGLPDMDIAVAGIGHHRSVFSHSVILGLGIEFTGRFTFMILENIKGRLPEPHHTAWDKVFNFMDKNREKAVMAVWLGIGTHLIKDSGLITGGVKPYADMPVSMTKEAHQATFAINGMTATAFGSKGDV